MTEMEKRIVLGLISILGAGNIYFVKGLVDEQKKQGEILWQMRQEVVVLRYQQDQKCQK